jgi:hypothetical protein
LTYNDGKKEGRHNKQTKEGTSKRKNRKEHINQEIKERSQEQKKLITKKETNCLSIAQAVSRRPLTAESRIRARVSPCGICGGQCGSRTGLSPSSTVLPCQYHFAVTLHVHTSAGG